jgi:hypothetical protein
MVLIESEMPRAPEPAAGARPCRFVGTKRLERRHAD